MGLLADRLSARHLCSSRACLDHLVRGVEGEVIQLGEGGKDDLALGQHGYLYAWLRKSFPQFDMMRFPIKFVALLAFAVPIPAGLAARRLCASPAGTARSAWRTGMIVAASRGSRAANSLKARTPRAFGDRSVGSTAAP